MELQAVEMVPIGDLSLGTMYEQMTVRKQRCGASEVQVEEVGAESSTFLDDVEYSASWLSEDLNSILPRDFSSDSAPIGFFQRMFAKV